jgi:hypothetical protein
MAGAEVAGQHRTAFDLAGAEQRLLEPAERERIAFLAGNRGCLRFGDGGTVPGEERDDRRSM